MHKFSNWVHMSICNNNGSIFNFHNTCYLTANFHKYKGCAGPIHKTLRDRPGSV